MHTVWSGLFLYFMDKEGENYEKNIDYKHVFDINIYGSFM